MGELFGCLVVYERKERIDAKPALYRHGGTNEARHVKGCSPPARMAWQYSKQSQHHHVSSPEGRLGTSKPWDHGEGASSLRRVAEVWRERNSVARSGTRESGCVPACQAFCNPWTRPRVRRVGNTPPTLVAASLSWRHCTYSRSRALRAGLKRL